MPKAKPRPSNQTITGLQLINFKCFADSGHIPLAPLTLVFGRNNTGKSSVLHSLLLMRQTMDAIVQGPRLNIRGPYYEGGAYSDIVHMHKASRALRLAFSVRTQDEQDGEVAFEFSSDEPELPRLTLIRITIKRTHVVEMRRGRGAGGPFELYIDETKIPGKQLYFPRAGLLPVFSPLLEMPAVDQAEKILNTFRVILSRLRGISAFRRQPERRYEYQGRLPDAPDLHGDRAVNAIIEDSLKRDGGSLISEVNRWLKEIGRVRFMSVRPISRVARMFEVRMRDTDSERWANFADVGFGIGQAFPVFVEGLRTPVGGTFLVQEPEIHLHPDAQLAMGEFLVELALSGRNVIVETHSENLLLRVRTLIASSKGPNKGHGKHLTPDKVSLLHVGKSETGEGRIKRLSLDELGQIENWPAGFMEEAANERLRLLHEMARASRSRA